MKEYSITHHAIDRLIERCARATSRWPELLNRDKNPNKYKKVIEEISNLIIGNDLDLGKWDFIYKSKAVLFQARLI